ncbi:unnamed protein product [Clonostachys rosea]|uniref:Uncharacterized protein n=1 Tax=Bionectria ochroleuca TaxID=29856 RepID=A0ABY6TQU4_BIOOC|nr:unnamed protein product [Clonostachys rosea]
MSSKTQRHDNTTSSSDEEKRGVKRREVSRDSSMGSPNPKRPRNPSAKVGIGEIDGADSGCVCSEGKPVRAEADQETAGQEDSESTAALNWPIPDENIRAKIYDEWYPRKFHPDAIFRGPWTNLKVKVSVFVRKNFLPGYSWKNLSKEIQAEIEVWASHAQEWMESSNALRSGCFFEAWIFRLLYDHLFSPGCQDKWSCEMWKLYGQLQCSLRDENLYKLVHFAVELDLLMIYSHLWLKMEMKVPNTRKIMDFPYDDSDAATQHSFWSPEKAAKSIPQVVNFICQPSLSIHGKNVPAQHAEVWKVLARFGDNFQVQQHTLDPVVLAVNGGEDQGFEPVATALQDTDVKSEED